MDNAGFIPGSNVYVYTTGNASMKMTFLYPNPRKGVGQKTRGYKTFECFSMMCGDGHLTILDPLDDVLGTHGLTFDDLTLESVETKQDNNCGTDMRWRVAFVMRRLENLEEYFVDSSFIHPNDSMLESLKTSTANNYVGENEGRNAYE
jgi:hypothetical protein